MFLQFAEQVGGVPVALILGHLQLLIDPCIHLGEEERTQYYSEGEPWTATLWVGNGTELWKYIGEGRSSD